MKETPRPSERIDDRIVTTRNGQGMARNVEKSKPGR
jgi:hypothetical protein